ncbi:rabankyrin-5-like [Mytilus trossulus]|uniref:rabankyrin-5-like n=1 Tax=Mytilus trossulus TaxID=6551 RepID=UPI0030071551
METDYVSTKEHPKATNRSVSGMVKMLSKDSGISLSTDYSAFGYHVKDFETIPVQDVEEKVASIIANEKSNLEKQIEANDFEKQKLMDEISKLKDNIENEPHHVLELQKEILQHWSNVLNKIVITKAAKVLYQHIQTKNVIAIIGPLGTGKSAYAYHIAFRLQNEYGYTIVPAIQLSDITQCYKPGTNQIFIIDDFIGKYAFDEAEGVSLEKQGPLLQKILHNNDQTKVILTCRKSIWHPEKYKRFAFSAFVCDLHTKELRLTLSEKRKIFEAYIDRGDVEPLNDEMLMMYSFFPSLCSIFSSINVGASTSLFTMPVQFIEEEINNYEEKSQARYISLAVLAIKQKINKKTFLNDIESEEWIKTLFAESGFQTCPSKKLIISHLVALTDTYVKVDNDRFEFIHETMQNIVLYCIAKTFLISVLKYCNSDVFQNQVRLACIDEQQTVTVIKVKSEYEEAYFTRLTRELDKGQYSEVFGNNQNDFTIFRKKWLVHINKIRPKIPWKTNLVGLSTILHIVSSLGYEDYVSHFIKIDTRIVDQADADGNTPLHLASLNGHLETVKCLVAYSRHVHILNKEKVSPFLYACENNEILVVAHLTNLKGDLVQINETYTTREHKSVLHIACLNGFTQIVQLLLNHHPNVDIQDKNGLTPLHLTCLNGQYNTASLLLICHQNRPNINALDMFQRTPVYYACIGRYTEIVKLLIRYKADINQSTSTGSTPLHAACEKESIKIVEILIENLANVNVKEKTVESPLHVACRHGNEPIIKLLIDQSALVNSKTKDKMTPLHIACSYGHHNVVNILLEKNASYKQRNKNGWTALLFSCEKGNNEIVKMLLNLETDVNISNSDGITPLMLACKGNNINVVQTLLTSNADVTQCDNDKSSPLEYACTAGNVDIVNVLVEHGACINFANKSGITPLHAACMNNHIQVVKALIEKMADINSVDVLCETPLYKVCYNGEIEIVKILLSKGAKINITNTSGTPPVAIAKKNGFSSIVELLDNANIV